MLQVVKNKYVFRDHELGVGKFQLVRKLIREILEKTYYIIPEVSNGPSIKPGKPICLKGVIRIKQPFKGENRIVNLLLLGFSILFDNNASPFALKDKDRIDTYERISPPLLAAFDAFEEKRMPSSHLFKDPYCGLGVSPYLLVDRNQIAGLRPFQKLFFGGRGYTCHWLPLRARQRITSQNWRSDLGWFWLIRSSKTTAI